MPAVDRLFSRCAELPRFDQVPGGPVPAPLKHGLDRVLFNPGVHFMTDPASGVFNFDPRLRFIPQLEESVIERMGSFESAHDDKVRLLRGSRLFLTAL